MLSKEEIARVAHEVNAAYCRALGDDSQVSWDEAPEWQKKSALNGVEFHQKSDSTPEESHANWLKGKEADGWKYGPVKDPEKDPEKKEHPCFLPYEELPTDQKAKDYIFRTVVNELSRKG